MRVGPRLYLCGVGPGRLAVQQCVQRIRQQLFSLWTLTADDVTGGPNASEKVHVDRWSRGSRRNIGQVHVRGDLPSRRRLRAWDGRENSAHAACKMQELSDIYILQHVPWLSEDFAGAERALQEAVRAEETFPFMAPLWLPVRLFPEPDLWTAWE